MGEKFDEDLKSYKMLSVALSRIIKHTANNEFREQCFKLLKTDSRVGAQTVLAANLSSIVSHIGQFNQEKRKTTRNKNTKKPTDDKTH